MPARQAAIAGTLGTTPDVNCRYKQLNQIINAFAPNMIYIVDPGYQKLAICRHQTAVRTVSVFWGRLSAEARPRFRFRTDANTGRSEVHMPYRDNVDLPAALRRHLPEHAQDIYRAAFNNAFAAHAGDPRQEEAAHRIAWAAVKRAFVKVGDEWVARSELE